VRRDDVIDFFNDFYFSNDEGYMHIVDKNDNFVCFVDAGDPVVKILEKIMSYEGAE